MTYGRYATFIVSVFGMLMLGENTYRAKPVLSLLLLVLSNLYFYTRFTTTAHPAVAVPKTKSD